MLNNLPWSNLELINPTTKKIWNIEIDGYVIRTCLNHGKIKEKEEKNTQEKAIQAVMAQLRKGFVYKKFDASPWQAVMHQFIDKPYTGFMPIAASTDRSDFYVIRTKGKFEAEILYHFDKNGQLLDSFNLGANRLTYCAVLQKDGTLLFDTSAGCSSLTEVSLDISVVSGREYIHQIERFYPAEKRLEAVNDEKSVQIIARHSDYTAINKNLKASIICGERGLIEICNRQTEVLLAKLQNEFTVRNAFCAFSSDKLIVHTDYGVLSLYKIN